MASKTDPGLTKLELNNFILKNRDNVRRAKVQIYNNFMKLGKKLSNMQAKDERLNKRNARKVDILMKQIKILKNFNLDDLTKYALMNKNLLEDVANDDNSSLEERILCRVATYKTVLPTIQEFRIQHPDWEERVPQLIKSLGLRYRKTRLKKIEERGMKDKFLEKEQHGFSLLQKFTCSDQDRSLLAKARDLQKNRNRLSRLDEDYVSNAKESKVIEKKTRKERPGNMFKSNESEEETNCSNIMETKVNNKKTHQEIMTIGTCIESDDVGDDTKKTKVKKKKGQVKMSEDDVSNTKESKVIEKKTRKERPSNMFESNESEEETNCSNIMETKVNNKKTHKKMMTIGTCNESDDVGDDTKKTKVKKKKGQVKISETYEKLDDGSSSDTCVTPGSSLLENTKGKIDCDNANYDGENSPLLDHEGGAVSDNEGSVDLDRNADLDDEDSVYHEGVAVSDNEERVDLEEDTGFDSEESDDHEGGEMSDNDESIDCEEDRESYNEEDRELYSEGSIDHEESANSDNEGSIDFDSGESVVDENYEPQEVSSIWDNVKPKSDKDSNSEPGNMTLPVKVNKILKRKGTVEVRKLDLTDQKCIDVLFSKDKVSPNLKEDEEEEEEEEDFFIRPTKSKKRGLERENVRLENEEEDGGIEDVLCSSEDVSSTRSRYLEKNFKKIWGKGMEDTIRESQSRRGMARGGGRWKSFDSSREGRDYGSNWEWEGSEGSRGRQSSRGVMRYNADYHEYQSHPSSSNWRNNSSSSNREFSDSSSRSYDRENFRGRGQGNMGNKFELGEMKEQMKPQWKRGRYDKSDGNNPNLLPVSSEFKGDPPAPKKDNSQRSMLSPSWLTKGKEKEKKAPKQNLQGTLHPSKQNLQGMLHPSKQNLQGTLHPSKQNLQGTLHPSKQNLQGTLHPSWLAKQKEKEKAASIHNFQGKVMKFDFD